MKRLGITQRVDIAQKTGERRDALDQRWYTLTQALGFALVPLPNLASQDAPEYLAAMELDALIFSGGNSLSHLAPMADDRAPERDAFETAAITFAIENTIPLLGVCRGMQMLNCHFGGNLTPIEGHVACRHTLTVTDDCSKLVALPVNSYHNWAIAADTLGPDLRPIAYDESGNIEAFVHNNEKISGIMWHPERETPLRSHDLKLLEYFLT